MMVSTTTQSRVVFVVGLFIAFFAISLQVVQSDEQSDSVISEVQCRPFIEKALKGREAGSVDESNVDENHVESPHSEEKREDEVENEDEKASLEAGHDVKESGEDSKESGDTEDLNISNESNEEVKVEDEESKEKNYQSVESAEHNQSNEDSVETNQQNENVDSKQDSNESTVESIVNNKSSEDVVKDDGDKTEEEKDDSKSTETVEVEEEKKNTSDVSDEISKVSEETKDTKSEESIEEIYVSLENKTEDSSESSEVRNSTENDSKENENVTLESEEKKNDLSEEKAQVVDVSSEENNQQSERQKREAVDDDNKSGEKSEEKSTEKSEETIVDKSEKTIVDKSEENNEIESKENDKSQESEPTPEEDLIQEIEIPKNLRPREHINQILKLDHDNEEKEAVIQKASDVVLKELKRLYDTAIKPLETLYKYRDLSNRHFGDPEIFSKPLVLLMGPWSGGKSSIINYLLDNEYQPTALRTGGVQECIGENCKPPNGTDPGAEPSPAYFNILMHGEEEEILDGTQLAADWTFSGLQKFGQGMLDRLRGLKLKNKLLEKVNIVEIPGILEIRKQVQRLFPFNDACQWFIDRADIIFLVYDPSKLDVGPETEAILDQLKGREYQTRIILNKADQVKPEELMRVQGALIWNISPLMSSAEPPVMYSTSLWSLPYEAGAPTRLLYAQERAFLRDLRSAIDKRVEHKIASARRFAVRVRNHAKMVDCYLTTYFNHKTFFGNKKDTSDKIIENPQDYHIYEGLSTLTNISRYDLPDPDVYRDFFRLNALHEFQPLSSTCTYFRGCPINRLDVAIAYDLPELVGKYRKLVETPSNETNNSQQSTS